MASRGRLLYGRSSAVSRQLGLLTVGLLVLGTATFYTNVDALWPLPLGASGVVLLVGLATLEAYYNDGLLVAWALTFAAALPAVTFHLPREPQYVVTLETVAAAVTQAAGVALLLGTVGFALGATLRRQHGADDYVPSATVLPAVFVGRDTRMAARWLLLSAVVFVVIFVGVWTGVLPFGFGLGGELGITVLLVLMGGPAALYAARNGGLLVCWTLAFAPLFGVFLALQLGATFEPAPTNPALFALGVSLLYAIPVGTVGFLLGLLERHFRRSRRSPPEPKVSAE